MAWDYPLFLLQYINNFNGLKLTFLSHYYGFTCQNETESLIGRCNSANRIPQKTSYISRNRAFIKKN